MNQGNIDQFYNIAMVVNPTQCDQFFIRAHFCKIRAESGRIFNKNPGKIRVKLIFCDYVVFFYLGHVQSIIFPFGKQLNNALNVH